MSGSRQMVVVEEDNVSWLDDETGGMANEEDANGGLLVDDVGNGLRLVDNDACGLVVEDSDCELPGEVNAS